MEKIIIALLLITVGLIGIIKKNFLNMKTDLDTQQQ